MTVELRAAERPLVSIVMVTYGGWDWPRRALEAVRDHTDAPYEVVIVDNDSPDGTAERLREGVRGARLILHDRNVGFAPAVNRGVLAARGEHICILNPDALVQPLWLPPLLEAVARPEVGAVVPLFLEPDGRVQEAGSLVDRQGWTFAIGAGGDPRDLALRSARAIDYGSAACLVMRRETFHRVGGLDAAYLPAYVEDLDLAFALRELGLRTVFEPRSSVVHGGTVSSDVATRTRLIEANREVFLDRWSDRLEGRPPLEELDRLPHRLHALRDVLAPVRLLVVAGRLGTAAGEAVIRMARGRLDARVTALAVEVREVEPLVEAGVEVALGAGEPWLEDRLFHFTAILAWGPAGLERWGGPIRRTQPQAVRVYAAPGAPPGTGLPDVDRVALEEAEIVVADEVAGRPGGRLLRLDDPRWPDRLMTMLGAAPPAALRLSAGPA
ncbi:MAG TPA: glycosyltransferase family 2 protein [Actinomycetota bacterium]